MTNEKQMWLTNEEAEIIFKLRKIPDDLDGKVIDLEIK